jgi:hypothetical protein
MLQKVRSAIGLIRLRATSSIYPHTNSARLCPGRVLCRNLQLHQRLPILIEYNATYSEAIG